jgi:hypothetical protein
MNIKNIILLLAMALLIACSENIENEQASIPTNNGVVDDLVPVEFSVSGLRNFDFTRALTSIVSLDAGEKVKVWVKPAGSTDYSGYDYTTATSGQANVRLTTPTLPPYYPPGTNTTVEAYAYYPSTAGDTETFTVQDDQTLDVDYKASDLMYAVNRTVTKDGNDGNDCLTMEHQMAQLVITAQAQTGSSLTISEVEVEAFRSITFDPSPSATDRMSAPSNKGTITALKAAGTGYVVIPPQVINGVIIRVKTGSGTTDETATYAFTGTTGSFQSGATYNLNLTVSPDQLGLALSVSNWNGLGSVNITPSGNLTVSPITAQEYTGQALTPAFTVYRDGAIFSPDNYNVQWVNNKESGVAYIIVTGKNMGNGADYSTCVGLTSFIITPAYGKINYPETSVTKTYGNEPFTNPLSNYDTRDGDVSGGRKADGPVAYTSSRPEVATVNEATGEVTILKAGTTTITATASSGANYVYDTTLGNHTSSYELTVNEAAGNISFGYPTPSKNWSPTTSNNKYTQEVTKTGDGAVTYSVPDVNTTNNTCGATIVNPSSGEVTFTKSGSVVVTATVSDTEHYKYAVKTASYTLTVNKTDGYITLSEDGGTVNAGSNATITVSSSHGGTLSAAATSGATNRIGSITINGNTVTVPTNGYGTTSVTITVTCAANDCYNTASATYDLDIEGSFDIKMNPLWYMAQYNVKNSTGTEMATTNDAGYYFTWPDAISRLTSGSDYSVYTNGHKQFTGGASGESDYYWHMPCYKELLCIFPATYNTSNIMSYSGAKTVTNVIFGYNTTTKAGITDNSYWVKHSSTEIHAIRFLGTDYCSAWRYVWGSNSLTVYATLINKIANASDASTWYNDNWNTVTFGESPSMYAVKRVIYASGGINSGKPSGTTATEGHNSFCRLWTASTADGSNQAWSFRAGPTEIYTASYTRSGGPGYVIRMFKDN